MVTLPEKVCQATSSSTTNSELRDQRPYNYSNPGTSEATGFQLYLLHGIIAVLLITNNCTHNRASS